MSPLRGEFLTGVVLAVLSLGFCFTSARAEGEYARSIEVTSKAVIGWSNQRAYVFDPETCELIKTLTKKEAYAERVSATQSRFGAFVGALGEDGARIAIEIETNSLFTVEQADKSLVVGQRNGSLWLLSTEDTNSTVRRLNPTPGHWSYDMSSNAVAFFRELEFSNVPYEMPPAPGILEYRAGWDPKRPRFVRPLAQGGDGVFLSVLGGAVRHLTTAEGLSSPDVTCLDLSADSMLVGYLNGSVDICSLDTASIAALPRSPTDWGAVTAVCWADSTPVVGTLTDGLWAFDQEKKRWEKVTLSELAGDARVNSLRALGNRIWVATDGAYIVLDLQSLASVVRHAIPPN